MRVRLATPPGSSSADAALAAHMASTSHINIAESVPTYHVRPDGNDSTGDGRWDRPLASVTKALSLIQGSHTTIGKSDSDAGADGGRILVHGVITEASPLNLRRTRGIIIEGDGGVSGGAAMSSAIRYSGAGSAGFIDARGSGGFCLRDISVQYELTSGFTGALVDLRQAPIGDGAAAAADCIQPEVSRCGIYANPANTVIDGTAIGIKGAGCDGAIIRGNIIKKVDVAIDGFEAGVDPDLGTEGVTYANAWLVEGNFLGSAGTTRQLVSGAIRNPGTSWTIKGNALENCGACTHGGIYCDGTRAMAGLTVEDNWFGDNHAFTGDQLRLRGRGIRVIGNQMSSTQSQDTGSTIIRVTDVCDGLVIIGNEFEGADIGIEWGTTVGHRNCLVLANDWFSHALKTIIGATWSGGYATFTTSTAHGLAMRQSVITTGVTSSGPGSYNVSLKQVVSIPSSTTFVVPTSATNPGTYTSGGTLNSAAAAEVNHPHNGTLPSTNGCVTQDYDGSIYGMEQGLPRLNTGLIGATAATRFVGGVPSVAPTTGTFAVGDYVISQSGKVFVCTTAGSPGAWTDVGSTGDTAHTRLHVIRNTLDHTDPFGASTIPYEGAITRAYAGASLAAGNWISGHFHGMAVWLPAGFDVSNLSFNSGGAGITFGSSGYHWWFALYDAATAHERGSNYALLAYTDDQTNTPWASNTLKTLPITKDSVGGTIASYTTVAEGIFYVGLMINAGTGGSPAMPQITGATLANTLVAGIAPIVAVHDATHTGLGATPASALAVGAQTAIAWCGVS